MRRPDNPSATTEPAAKPKLGMDVGIAEGTSLEVAVERMFGVGLDAVAVAHVLGLKGANEVNEKFAGARDRGKAKADFKVANALFTTAMDRNHRGHVTAAVFWARARMGWVEATPSEAAVQVPSESEHITDAAMAERFDDMIADLRRGLKVVK